MKHLSEFFYGVSTAQIADACIRLKIALKIAPTGIKSVSTNARACGRAIPCKHYGSVDIFLEAFSNSEKGDVLVIDNEGRQDEGCIGDLTLLEAKAVGLAGIIVYGVHRDSEELAKIGLPVFSYGSYPAGPTRLDARQKDALLSANFGNFTVSKNDIVFADPDGVIFVPVKSIEEIVSTATKIFGKERGQAQEIMKGNTLSNQLKFKEYLQRRKENPSYTFRKHIKIVGGAIEE
ncbi:MAG: RraA family protein [Planctomycetes bacterium]|nr:RraA family protein [Planctomycetota bacterium]